TSRGRAGSVRNPQPYGNCGSYDASPTLIGSCASDFAHVTGSRPVNGLSPNSVSATPAPSVPGSHEATSALPGSSRESYIGRPETTRIAHFIAPHTRSIAVRSAPESASVCPLPTSPTPSAYGVSPTTTTPAS